MSTRSLLQFQSTRLLILSAIAVAIGVATPFLLYGTPASQAKATQAAAIDESPQAVRGPLKKGTPDYNTVLPGGKSIQEYGGWTRVSPPNRNPVYAYADKIGAIPITVSEQPLPTEFSEQPEQQIQQLAQGYGANTSLKVSGATVYIGTSAKGPQSVIVVRDKLLLLIKASAVIPDNDWKNYIESLK